MPKKQKIDIWDIIIWLSLIILIIYIIAKIAGLINTPEWINLIPIITLVFFAGAFYQKLLIFMEKMLVRTDYLKKNVDNLNSQVKTINTRLLEHDKKLKNIE